MMTCKHERKSCARCQSAFECKVGDVTHCQCYGIILNVEEKAFIEDRYNDCLCRNCLLELKQRYLFFKEKYFLHEGK
jgi:hypothetical protein